MMLSFVIWPLWVSFYLPTYLSTYLPRYLGYFLVDLLFSPPLVVQDWCLGLMMEITPFITCFFFLSSKTNCRKSCEI